tara:strand:+ start:31351 stop:34794 length:3444 start_codon:yes stop_codon:yes gene_type:complete
MNIKYNLLTLCLFLIGTIFTDKTVLAQQNGEINFYQITPENGLSQSNVTSITQDYIGFMWFATQDGLNKYDGNEITVYKLDKNDPTSISYNDLSNIYEDRDQNLWISTFGEGLNLYNRKDDNFTRFNSSTANLNNRISGDAVFTVLHDSQGKLWVGTNNGISVRDKEGEPFKNIIPKDQFGIDVADKNMDCLYEDSKTNIWICTRTGLFRYNRESDSFKAYYFEKTNSKSIGSNVINDIVESSDSTIWLATQGGGLNAYHYETDSFIRYKHSTLNDESIADNAVLTVFEDSENRLWVGLENMGLDLFDREKNKFIHFKSDPLDQRSLNNSSIYSIYESKDNTLWFGTYAGGLNIYQVGKNKFERYSSDPYAEKSIGNNSVLSFVEDSKGNFWIGTDGGKTGGLHLFDFATDEKIDFPHDPLNENSPPSDVVLRLKEDIEGNIWLGTYQGGVSKFNYSTNSYTHFSGFKYEPYSLANDDVFGLYIDSTQKVWAGTNGGGSYTIDPKKNTVEHVDTFDKDLDTKANHVRDFLEDEDMFITTTGYGLVRLNSENNYLKYYTTYNSTNVSDVLHSIHKDKSGRIWVGTKGGGLELFDKKTEEFTSYSVKDGLPNEVVNCILEDNSGNLWLSTNNGISKFDPFEVTFTNYGMEDGLQSREFNVNACYKDSKGLMYFGGVKGFNRFDPDDISQSKDVHPIIFTDFQIFNRSVENGKESPLKEHIAEAKEIVVPYTASVLTFEYTSLNFNFDNADQFAYLLEGFDEDWNYVNNKRSATYTNLDPGKYTLKVKVANADEYWNPEEASLTLIITPPFWKTNLFYFLSFILIGGFIITGYRIRVRSITEQNKKLEVEVNERTAELVDKNKALHETFEDLKRTRSELIENAHKAGMADIAAGVLHNVGNILNSVNTSSSLISETLKNSRLKMLTQANKLLSENMDNLEEFILNNPKGKQLLEYYMKLEEPLKAENEELIAQSERLSEKIILINDVIAAQQSYATANTNNDSISLPTIIEDTLVLFTSSIDRHDIKLVKDFERVDLVIGQKTKLIHVLVNFIKNAKESMESIDHDKRLITIKLSQKGDEVRLFFSDTGAGVLPKNLTKIFNQGFTTKEQGHGLGLHSSANYIKDMGGKIEVKSEGENKGTTFIITLKKA